MTDLTLEQIKAAVLKALKEMADQFAKDPTPTDGTIRGIAAAPSRSRPARGSAKHAAMGKRRRGS